MQLPPNLAENTSAFLAAIAAAIGAVGLLLTLVCGVLLYFSVQGVGNSIGAIASIPPFSLDSGFAGASVKMVEAGASFSEASRSLNSSAEGIGNSTAALRKANDDIGSAKEKLVSAKAEITGAFGMMGVAVVIGTLSLAALFSSVLAISLSILVAYYPKLFEKGEKQEAKKN